MIHLKTARKLAARIANLAIEIGYPASMTIEVTEDEDSIYVFVRDNGEEWAVSFQKKDYQSSDDIPKGKDLTTDHGRFFYGLAEALGQIYQGRLGKHDQRNNRRNNND